MSRQSMHPRAELYLDHYQIAPHTEVNVSDRTADAGPVTVVVNMADKSWVLTFRQFDDHQCVDVDLFDDTPDVDRFWSGTAGVECPGKASPIGLFSIHQGTRYILEEATVGAHLLPVNHGWPATCGLVLVADKVGSW